MGLLASAIKNYRRLFTAYGGQGTVPAGLSDWWTWSPGGGAYNYQDAAGDVGQNGVVMACVAWLMRAFPEAPIQVVTEDEDGEDNEVPDHPLTRLFRKPNNYYGSDCLWQRVIYDWALHGQAYLYKLRSATGEILSLWHIPQHRLFPQWGTSGSEFISFYLHRLDGREERLPVTDLVHFRFGGDSHHERNGLPVLRAALREIATLNEAATYRAATLRNMGVPSHVLQSKNPERPLTRDQAEQLRAMWAERVCGSQRGGVLIPSFPLEALKVGMSPEELDLGKMTWEATDQTSAQLGVPSMVAGLSSGSAQKTYANFEEAREAVTECTLVPAWKQFGQELTLQLLPDYSSDERERVEFDLTNVRALQVDETALWTRIDTAVKSGWITINEARSLANLPETPGGDVFLPSQGEQPVNLERAQAQTEQAKANAQEAQARAQGARTQPAEPPPNGNGRAPARSGQAT